MARPTSLFRGYSPSLFAIGDQTADRRAIDLLGLTVDDVGLAMMWRATQTSRTAWMRAVAARSPIT
jgi:hypothetical protein